MSQEASELNFEQALRALEEIVHKLESGEAPLDESIALYERGNQLRALCQQRLDAAKARIEERAWLLNEENPTLDSLAEKIVTARTAKEELARVLDPLVSGVRYQAERLVNEGA